MGTPANQLEYAPGSAWGRRRRGVRRAIIVAVVLLVALGSIKRLGSAWGHAKLLYWQRLCMRHERPASQEIDLSDLTGTKEWMEFYALFSPPGRKAAPLVFLHEMRRKDGGARLVAIEPIQAARSNGVPDVGLWFDYHVIRPGSAWSRPRLLRNEAWYYPGMWRWIKLYPAQLDSKDPSHLTIRFELGPRKTSGVVDGWLQPDDSLLLEVRFNSSQAGSASR